jgi:hypothetical protein
MPNPADAALAIVGFIYDAASDPSLWADVLNRLAQAIGGTATGFTIHEIRARPGGHVGMSINIDPAFQKQYDDRGFCSSAGAQKGRRTLRISSPRAGPAM